MSNIKRHPDCRMRSTNGNCSPMGGFCTSNTKGSCEAMQSAYWAGHNYFMIEMANRKEALSAERTGKWIPVSERLPENNGRYLVSYDGIIGMRTNILHYGVPSPLHTRGAEKCFYDTDREYGDVPYEDVIAWQPLPEPYKGGDTE